MQALAYPSITPYSTEQLTAQLTHFPTGQFVAIHDGRVVGYTASFRAAEATAFGAHSFLDVTGEGTASRHDATGDWLYRMEICADPNFPAWRDGRRGCSAASMLVDALKDLCVSLGLKGVLSCSRMPGLGKHWREVGSAVEYVERVLARKLRDPVLAFHMHNGFQPNAVLSNYIPYDEASRGHAARVVWRNPSYAANAPVHAVLEPAAPTEPPARPKGLPPNIVVRNATFDDIDGIRTLLRTAYRNVIPYSSRQARGQIANYPEGQFVAVHDGKVVGYAVSFRVAEAIAFAPHTFDDISGNGYARRHDADGDWLYGMEVAVDPGFPSWRVGREVYSPAILLMQAGQEICRRFGLKGMVGGARMPALGRNWPEVKSAEAFIEAFKNRKLRDPVLSLHTRLGYEIVGLLPNYAPYDPDCLGYAALVMWRNPAYFAKSPATASDPKGETPTHGAGAATSKPPPTLPGAMHSATAGAAWPAIPADDKFLQLAIQFQLEQTQWWSAERIRQHQFAQLQQLVRHAGTTVPFYRERFKQIGFDPREPLTPEIWKKLPLLSRRDLQENFEALKSEALPRSHGGTFSTTSSGSTATPITVVKTSLQQLLFQTNTLRDHLWHKRDLSARMATIRAWDDVNDHPYPPGSVSKRWGPSSSFFATGSGFMLGFSAKLHEQVEWLQRVQPQYLMSYPSNFEAMAHYCLDNKIIFPWLIELRSMSEVLRPEVRDICRQAWGAEIKDTYSSEEVGLIALQSPVCEERLVMAETLATEVIDEKGRECAPGTAGRLIVTPLHAFAMPLLRLAQGDLAVPGGPARCGRGLPVLKEVLGRERNMVKLPNGQLLYPSYHYLTRGLEKVIQFQIVRKAVELLEVRLVSRAPLNDVEQAMLVKRVQERFQYPFKVRIAYVDEVKRTRRGKFIDYLSEVD